MTNEEAVKAYIQYLVEWIVNKCDLELEPSIEYEVIRIIYDSSERYFEEKK